MMHTLLLVSLFVGASAADTTVSAYSDTGCEGDALEDMGSLSTCTKRVDAATCIGYGALADDDTTKSILWMESDEGAVVELYKADGCKTSPSGVMVMMADSASKSKSAQCMTVVTGVTVEGATAIEYYKWSASAPEYGTLSKCNDAACTEGCVETANAGTVTDLDAHCCDWASGTTDDPAKSLIFGCLGDGSAHLRSFSSTGCDGDLGFMSWLSKDNADKAEQGQCYVQSLHGGTQNMNVKWSQAQTLCGGSGSGVGDASSTLAFRMPLATMFMSMSMLVAMIQV